MPTCLLVRHGHSTANADGILAGWTEGVGLTEQGHGQAKALAAQLAELPISLIVSSPLQRCRETAAVVEDATAARLEVDDSLGECRYGGWTGRALTDLSQEPLWRMVQDHPSAARFPDSAEFETESISEMAQRVVAAVRRWDALIAAEAGDGALWVAVTHADLIKAVLADAAGAHLDHFQRFQADPGSVSVVRHTQRRPFLIASNLVGGDLSRLAHRPAADAGAGEAPEGDAEVGGGA